MTENSTTQRARWRLVDRTAAILERYNAEGLQGVYAAWGDSGVYEVLRNWRAWHMHMKVENDTRLTVGADYCYHGGGNIYSQGQMGVHIGASDSFGSGGVFTMTADSVNLFKTAMQQVLDDRDEVYRSAENPMELRLTIPNYLIGVSDSHAGEIRIGLQKTEHDGENVILQFLPADGLGGRGRMVVMSRSSAHHFGTLLDEAVRDVQLHASVEERAKLIIERGRAAKPAS